MTDAELVHETLRGDRSAYEQLVRRWSGPVTGFVRSRVRRVDISEDLAQEVLLRGFRKLSTLAAPEKFGSWLMSIAHALSTDWLKAKARTEVSLSSFSSGEGSEPDPFSNSDPSPVQNCLDQEQKQLLRQAIDQLPQAQREVLLIYYYQDVTYDQIAQMLGVSSATINARLTKARTRLREQFSTSSRQT